MRVVVRAVPPVGVKVVVTTTARRVATASRWQISVTVVARVTVSVAVQAARRADDTRRYTPRCVTRPAEGRRMLVMIDVPTVRDDRARNRFDGGVGAAAVAVGVDAVVAAAAPGVVGAALSTVNVAVALVAPVIVTLHVVEVPVQAPLQPANVEPLAGVAVSVTVLDSVNEALQVAPQLIPASDETTEPLPLPAVETMSKALVGAARVTAWINPEPTSPQTTVVAPSGATAI